MFIRMSYYNIDFMTNIPSNQMRLKLTTELLLNANLLSPEQIVQPRIATGDELM